MSIYWGEKSETELLPLSEPSPAFLQTGRMDASCIRGHQLETAFQIGLCGYCIPRGDTHRDGITLSLMTPAAKSTNHGLVGTGRRQGTGMLAGLPAAGKMVKEF